MIVLNSESSEPIQEAGMIDAALKAADIDADKIKDEWKDSAKGIGDKLQTLNDEGLSKAKNLTDIGDKYASKHISDNRSIIARARNSVLQFPIYVTQTLRVNEAQIISKLFERVYTSLVQTVLSQNPIINEEEANNLVFLKRFHTNIKEAADIFTNKYYQPIDDMDQMMAESIFHTQKISENCVVEFRVVPTTDQDIILENARLMNEPLSGFMYLREAGEREQIKEKEETHNQKVVNLTDQDLKDMAMNNLNISQSNKRLLNTSDEYIKVEVNKKMQSSFPDSISSNASKYEKDEYQKAVEEWKKKRDAEIDTRLAAKYNIEKKIDKEIDTIKKNIKDGKLGAKYIFKNGRYVRIDDVSSTKTKTTDRPKAPEREKELRSTPVESAIDTPKLLRDTDIKKINGLLPYSIEATFRIRTKEGLDRDVRYIIGIKSVMHLIRTQDLADDLRELITGNIKSLQKVRYKTGEINFFDYLFNIKNLKKDAAKNINYNKRWINTLKRLAEYDKLHGSLLKKPVEAITNGNVPIPNGTLVLSQPDVTTLTNQTGIDLSIVSNAKRLAKSLFLIAIVIVDSSAGSMRVLFPDSDSNWDVQSLASIDAEVSKTDNSQLMKELNQMVNRR